MEWYLMVWRRAFDFDGRSRRKEYWMFSLINLVVYFVLFAVLTAGAVVLERGGTASSATLVRIAAGLCGLYGLATLIPGLAVSVRRLHDIGRSGWWLLIGLIPLGGLVLLVFDCIEGTPGPNEYGPDPKAPAPWSGQPMAFR